MNLREISRFLFPMRAHLLDEIDWLHSHYGEMVSAKDTEIRRLRAELASRGVTMVPKIENIARPQVPLASVPDGPLDWNGELQQMLKEEEDGIRSGRRVQEHEPRADDGA